MEHNWLAAVLQCAILKNAIDEVCVVDRNMLIFEALAKDGDQNETPLKRIWLSVVSGLVLTAGLILSRVRRAAGLPLSFQGTSLSGTVDSSSAASMIGAPTALWPES